jgi:uncharacterized RDD family membrane protein YckC
MRAPIGLLCDHAAMPTPRFPDRTDPTDAMNARLWAGVTDYILLPGIVYAVFAFQGLSVQVVNECTVAAADCAALDDGRFVQVEGSLLGAVLALFLVFFGNLVVLQGSTGASIGKLLLDLRVVDRHLVVAGYWRCLVRTLLWVFPDSLGFCVPMVGPITALVTSHHRRLGDFAGGTMVVRGRFAVPKRERAAVEAGLAAARAGEPVDGTGRPSSPPPGGMHPSDAYADTSAPPLEPVWDEGQGTYVLWDPRRQAWLRFDEAGQRWEPFQPGT